MEHSLSTAGVVLSLNSSDNDPIVLLNDLVQSLEGLAPAAGGLHAELSRPAPDVDRILYVLAEEVATPNRRSN